MPKLEFASVKAKLLSLGNEGGVPDLEAELMRIGYFRFRMSLLNPDQRRRFIDKIPDVFAHEAQLRATYGEREKPPGWQMTDPQQHDPNNFRYIIHSINYENNFVPSLRGEPLKQLPSRGHFHSNPYRDLEGFLAREATSCTLIDEIHRGTYGEGCMGIPSYHGFVLHVPEENILAVATWDMGKPWDIEDAEFVRQRYGGLKNRTSSATEFLGRGDLRFYNEVVVQGRGPSGNALSVAGIYILVDPFSGVPLYELELRNLRGFANLLLKWEQFNSRFIRDPQKRFFQESYLKGVAESNQIYRQGLKTRLQEAHDLAELLDVPIIPIPQMFDYPHLRTSLPPELLSS